MKKGFIMKKLVLLIAITVIWLSAIDISFSGDNGEVTLYYFTLPPGIAQPNDTVLNIGISSFHEDEVFIEGKNSYLIKDIKTKPNDFINIGLTAEDAQVTTKYRYNLPDDKPYEKLYEKSAIRLIVHGTNSNAAVVRTKYGKNTDEITLMNSSLLSINYQISNTVISKYSENIPSNYAAIVGVYDYTKVKFIMGGCSDCYVFKENGDTLKYNDTIQRIINEHDVWLIPASGINAVLTGSKVRANKPVAVYSANNSSLNEENGETNYTISQEIPENIWGTQYLVPPFVSQSDYPVVNIFAKKIETQILVNGSPEWFINNPGGILGSGFIQSKLDSLSEKYPKPIPLEISSENQINVVMIQPGKSVEDKQQMPLQMQILPTSQFSNYSIFKINSPDFDNITLIYKATVNGDIPDDLLISEFVDGKNKWMKLNAFTTQKGSRFISTLMDGTHYRTLNMKFLYAGTYSFKSNNLFGVYQYGFSDSISYGYPIISSSPDLETPDSLAPFVEYSVNSNCDADGIVIDEPRIDPYNRANLGLVYMATEDSYNYIFDCDKFTAGVDSSSTWRLKIKNPALNGKAHLVFYDRVGNRKDTIIECTAIVSVQENDLINSIEIRFDNGFLKFYSKKDYQIDEIEIYDLSGKLILNDRINQILNGYSLRTDNFTLGIYIVKIYINGKWFSKKVII